MKIGLLANFTNQWIGGMYYIRNIILSLNALPDEKKPEIVLFYHIETPTQLFDSVNYPKYRKVCLQRMPLWKRGIYKLARLIFSTNFQLKEVIDSEKTDVLFPLIRYYDDLKTKTPLVYWIFDFQHKFLPEYFSENEIKNRDYEFKKMSENANKIIVSSIDAKNRLMEFFPNTTAQIKVLQFISIIDIESLSNIKISDLKSKYKLSDKQYFIVSNQFWKHKNHIVVFKALKELSNPPFDIVFTGLEEDSRNPDYLLMLNKYLVENKIEANIKRLGFIPREEQLMLLLHSIAGIQPSEFEGWNTSIEDAKTLNKTIIASDLLVHKEQLGDKGIYFEKNDFIHLSKILQNCHQSYLQKSENIDFVKLKENLQVRQLQFGEKILSALSD